MNFDLLVKDLLDNPELILQKDFSEDELLEIQKRINPYSSFCCEGLDDPNFKKSLIFSYTNLREEYIKHFLMTSIIGFIYQIYDEYEIERSDRLINSQNTEISNEIKDIKGILSSLLVTTTKVAEDNVAAEDNIAGDEVTTLIEDNASAILSVKDCFARLSVLEDKLNEPVELPEIGAKTFIKDFLSSLFKFNPNVHVRSAAIDEEKIIEEVKTIGENEIVLDAGDPSRLPLKTLLLRNVKKDPEHLETYKKIVESQQKYNAFCTILSDDSLLSAMEEVIKNQLAFKAYLFPLPENSDVLAPTEVVPPMDTFHRWSYYNEVNFEEIRRITAALYFEKPDLDLLIGAWNTIEGEPEKVDEEFNRYCQKYQSEFPSEIKSIDFGRWGFIGDFKQNRETIQFYNKNTEILKRILDRYEEDKKIGAELMKNRIKQKKAKNIAEYGPDAEGLSQYRSVHGISLPGCEKVISNEEMLRLEKTKGNIKAAKELEVLEQLEAKLEEMNGIKESRELTIEETRELERIHRALDRAHQMASVPEDAIQVDVFTNDTQSGEFKKSSFYTKSEELINSHLVGKKNK